jgi:hypothetical protein
MSGDKTGWLMILLSAVLVLQIFMLIHNQTGVNEHELLLQKRDSVIQKKIDSINTSINERYDHEIYENGIKLDEQNQKILINKTSYKEREKELLQNNTADSVYNWVKHKLRERTGDSGRFTEPSLPLR